MPGVRTVPLLPCGDVDAIIAFYALLGFKKTFRQVAPYACAIVKREDFELHFFGMKEFVAENSYGSCIVVVPDADGMYAAFASGLKAGYGKLPVTGIPRITRPRKKGDSIQGFSVIDPGGNWIRIYGAKPDTRAETAPEKLAGLALALKNAERLGEQKGDPALAARGLDQALQRHGAQAGKVERVAALVYRAELALAMSDSAGAAHALEQSRGLALSPAERKAAQPHLERASELSEELA